MAIELGDVQSNVLRGYRGALPHVAYAFLALPETEQARAFVRDTVPLTTSCSAFDRLAGAAGDERFIWNLGFTFAGMRALGANARDFERDAAFALGPAERAEALGDRGASAPEAWEAVYRAPDLHAVVSLSAWAPDGIARGQAKLDALLARHPRVRRLGQETGDALPG